MEREFLQLQTWDQFTSRESTAVARALARCLPGAWQFETVATHSCGELRREVALFRWRDGARFALVPGGEVTLGHDPARPLGPQLQERRDWVATDGGLDWPDEFASDEEEDRYYENETRQEYFHWSDFFAWLERLPGPRTVVLAPFLIETEPRSCEDIGADLTFQALSETISAEGLRLPSSDEWEHACAGGARTVWRWGDVCPDHSPEEDGPDLLHCQPNAFGLRYHAYRAELVAEPGVRRNTDGGVAFCGGHGFPCAWLALASANVRDYHALGWDRPEEPLRGWLLARRAFTVPPEALE
jgi:hypothetical protein